VVRFLAIAMRTEGEQGEKEARSWFIEDVRACAPISSFSPPLPVRFFYPAVSARGALACRR
jgi:hypothetical protein